MAASAITSGFKVEPRLRIDLNAATLLNPPGWWSGPRNGDDLAEALIAAGYEGLQDRRPRPDLMSRGLKMTGIARVLTPDEADRIAEQHRGWGFQSTTLHVGTGMETDGEAARLVVAVLEASERRGYPLFVETHRATVTQDMRRTLDLVERFPALRFTADLSHWYTGHEFPYGDVEAKIAMLAPVFARVRFVHGRIGDSCCMQLPVPSARSREPDVRHFRAMWRLCFQGFLAGAAAGDEIVFAPELMPASAKIAGKVHRFNYARLNVDGEEESDRWADAGRLCDMARDCFDAVRAAAGSAISAEA
jgi:hypothetical protein